MLLHAALHRVEGDFENARAWMRSVGKDRGNGSKNGDSEGCDETSRGGEGSNVSRDGSNDGEGSGVSLLQYIYGSMSLPTASTNECAGSDDPLSTALELITVVEAFRKRKEGSEEALIEALRYESHHLLEWCVLKYGEGRWEDATCAWAQPPEKVRKIGEQMVSGGKGWREF